MKRASRAALAALLLACDPAAVSSLPSSTPLQTASIAAPSPTALPSRSSSPTPRAIGERLAAAAAWTRVRATIPSAVAVPQPTWLPNGLDPVVELRDLRADPPSYAVDYLKSGETALRFSLGGTPLGSGSGIGTRVRGASAALGFPSDLFNAPGGRGWRSLSWQEAGRTYVIESEILTGEDVLHAGWSLDRAGAPAPKNPYTRVRVGSCASTSSPEETARAFVLAFGRHDPDLVLDCFAMDYIGDSGQGFAAGDAELPTATIDRIGPTGPIGGRVYVAASWTFDRDPGSAWVQGQHGFQFFMIGIEDGRYRIFEGGTGAYGPPP